MGPLSLSSLLYELQLTRLMGLIRQQPTPNTFEFLSLLTRLFLPLVWDLIQQVTKSFMEF